MPLLVYKLVLIKARSKKALVLISGTTWVSLATSALNGGLPMFQVFTVEGLA
jgi:hypothetical protein